MFLDFLCAAFIFREYKYNLKFTTHRSQVLVHNLLPDERIFVAICRMTIGYFAILLPIIQTSRDDIFFTAFRFLAASYSPCKHPSTQPHFASFASVSIPMNKQQVNIKWFNNEPNCAQGLDFDNGPLPLSWN